MLDAWNYYLKNDNNGRGVVLVAHSQGSFILTGLIAREIDGKPVQSRLISAILLGTNIAVPKGKDVGGAFQKIPLCHAADQTGCVITLRIVPIDSPAAGQHALRQGRQARAWNPPAPIRRRSAAAAASCSRI